MVSQLKFCLTVTPSSYPNAKVFLTSGYQSVRHNVWTRSSNPPSHPHLLEWSKFLPWVQYTHNSHISAATGLSLFEISLSYQYPLFPADESNISVTTVNLHIHLHKHIWSNTVSALQTPVTHSSTPVTFPFHQSPRTSALVTSVPTSLDLPSVSEPSMSVSRPVSDRTGRETFHIFQIKPGLKQHIVRDCTLDIAGNHVHIS